ncbi:hypothetical protein IMZ48_45735 [Candidatus Bathyarchaeota archaeon]|nr:hypothetical protein [Candidatus Bathyarchaeota archaeon]
MGNASSGKALDPKSTMGNINRGEISGGIAGPFAPPPPRGLHVPGLQRGPHAEAGGATCTPR